MFTIGSNDKYHEDEAMSADVAGTEIDAAQYLNISFVSVVTGAAGLSGNLITESSNDGTNWFQRNSQAVAADGTFEYALVDHAYRYVRHRWVNTGGNGTLNTSSFVRGI